MPCCQHGAPTGCCPHDEPPPAPPQDPDPQDTDPADDEAPADGVRWVTGISAMKCRGHSTLWVSAGIVLPAPVLCNRPVLDPGGWLHLVDDHAFTSSLIPPDPPPRLANL
jgi:hypothetical protein